MVEHRLSASFLINSSFPSFTPGERRNHWAICSGRERAALCWRWSLRCWTASGSRRTQEASMTQALSVHYDVSADGRTVAEAEVDGIGAAQGTDRCRGGGRLRAGLGAQRRRPVGAGVCRAARGTGGSTGPARPGPLPDGRDRARGPRGRRGAARSRSTAASGGDKTPGSAGRSRSSPASTVLGLRRGGLIAGIRRIDPGGWPDRTLRAWSRASAIRVGYRLLLTAALSRVPVREVTVDSWGDGPERVKVCGERWSSVAAACTARCCTCP